MQTLKTFYVLLGLCLSGIMLQAAPVAAPASPRELLKALPPAQKGWVLKVSNATHTKTNPPNSRAMREYVYFDPALGAPTSSSVPLRTVKLMVLDTCLDQAILDAYAESSPGVPGPSALAGEWISVGQYRAIRRKVDKEADHVEMLFQKRFLITFVVVNGGTPAPAVPGAPAVSLPETRFEQWISVMNFGLLTQAASSAGSLETSNDYTFNVERIDEINPSRNKVIPISMGGSEPIKD